MSTPPPDPLLRLVFEGQCLEGQDPEAVRLAVARALKLDDARAADLFSGRRVVLRRRVDEATALRFIVRFRQLGAVVRAEPVHAAGPAPVPGPPPAPAPVTELPGRLRGSPSLPWRPTRRAVTATLAVFAALGLTWLLGRPLLGAWQDWQALRSRAPITLVADTPTPAVARDIVPPTAPALASTEAPALATSDGTARAPTDDELPEDMGPDARRDYRQRYAPAARHKAFALGDQVHAWQTGAASENEARAAALARCMQQQGTAGSACRIIDADGELQE